MMINAIEQHIDYFVSYQFNSRNGSGFGNCSVVRDIPIRSASDIQELQDSIARKTGNNGVVILFWREFETV